MRSMLALAFALMAFPAVLLLAPMSSAHDANLAARSAEVVTTA